MNPEVWTIKDVIQWSTRYLSDVQADSPRLDVELLLADVLSYQRIDLYTKFDQPLTTEERERFKFALRRRMAGEPVAYILGYKEFYGLSFLVNDAVLIPRPDTEHLIERAFKHLDLLDEPSPRVLDVGTGSGCIGLTLKKLRPNLNVEAWDVEARALELAKKNAEELGVAITFLQRDALKADSWRPVEAVRFDLICSNPPYIGLSEKSMLPPSVLKFEPHTALFAENDGKLFYQSFAEYAPQVLTDDGYIMLEFGYQQSPAVQEIFEAFRWRQIEVIKDLAGHDRVLVARKPEL